MNEPVWLAAIARIIVALALHFGFKLDASAVVGLLVALEVVLAQVVRSKVTPVSKLGPKPPSVPPIASSGFVALVLSMLVSCTHVPPAPPHPTPAAPDGGSDQCARAAAEHSAELAEIATRLGLANSTVVEACEAYCGPFASEGPDAAASNCLFAARNLGKFAEGGSP